MSDIPTGREMLLALADTTDPATAAQIRHIVDTYLVRRKQVRRAPVQSNEVTPHIRKQIILTASLHPDLTMAKLGEMFDVNQGRVSEILNGKR